MIVGAHQDVNKQMDNWMILVKYLSKVDPSGVVDGGLKNKKKLDSVYHQGTKEKTTKTNPREE